MDGCPREHAESYADQECWSGHQFSSRKVSGHISAPAAEEIAGAVHYDAEVSWNQAEAFTRRNNAGNLLYNVIILSFIVCGITLAAGIVFGVFRVWANKYYPGRFVNRTESIEYIRLKLDGRE